LNTSGQDEGVDGDGDRNNGGACNMISSFSHLGFQDLNDRQQAKKDLRHTQCGHTGIASKYCTVGTDTAKHMEESKATRMPRPGPRRFRPRARGDDFRQNMFVPCVGTPLMVSNSKTKRTGTSWNAQVYKPEFQEHGLREQQPKSLFQALHDHNFDQGLPPPSPMLYDSCTTTTSSPCSAISQAPRCGRRLHRQAIIGECQPAPAHQAHHVVLPEKQQHQQPPHMLSMSCSTMMTEDDDTIASFFVPDDDMSEVTWEGDFHKQQQQQYQQHQQHQYQQHQYQQHQQQHRQQASNNVGKKGVPSWTSRFLWPSRDVKSAAGVATDGVTTAADLHTSMSIPSCIAVVVAHRS
jgi:hypothetical protein